MRNLAGELYTIGARAAAVPGAPGGNGGELKSMPCPMSGCKHIVKLQPAAPPATVSRPPTSPPQPTGASNTYLTGDALSHHTSNPSQMGGGGGGAPQPPPSLEHQLASHLISEHMLELQALAALADSITLRAFSRNACPFHTLGPKACPGAKEAAGAGASPTKAAASSIAGYAGNGQKASPSPPAMSPTTRMFLSSGRPAGGAQGVGVGGPGSPSSGNSVDWWDHIHSHHLPDLVATVGSILKRCGGNLD